MSHAASAVILVRPTGFGFDPETASTNGFQRRAPIDDPAASAAAEFDALLDALRHCGIGITVLDPVHPQAPNAVFPNNWFSTHADGTVVLYPMQAPSRRRERPASAAAMMDLLRAEGLQPRAVLDLSMWEGEGRFLEGTGSLVIDRAGAIAYACLSPRAAEAAVAEWGRLMRHRTIAFTATMDGTLMGQPVYHTNVMMALGTRWALVCFEAMPYPAERQEVREELERSGREVIAFSLEQMRRFVGNALELRAGPETARNHVFLSETAFHALLPDQRLRLERHAQLVPVAVPCIEAIGGGSVRCMLAEDFLPRG